jgi:hypothetical protein
VEAGRAAVRDRNRQSREGPGRVGESHEGSRSSRGGGAAIAVPGRWHRGRNASASSPPGELARALRVSGFESRKKKLAAVGRKE